MLVERNDLNEALSRNVNAHLRAQTRAENARAALWRAGGAALLAAGIGAGLMAVLTGVGAVVQKRTTPDEIVSALQKLFEQSSLRIAGAVELKGDKTIDLRPGAVVQVAPSSRVQALGTVGVESIIRPSAEVLKAGDGERGATVVTNFTIFKEVKYGQGEVHTGWKFASSDARAPSSQYCYYTQKIEGKDAAITIDLAVNGRVNQRTANDSIDMRDAAASCIWFSR